MFDFEKAIRNKYRFNTNRGNITVEDLWDIPLTSRTTGVSLDDIAKELYKQLQNSQDTSFVVTKSSKNTVLEDKLELVKYIIKVRIEEKEKAENIAAKKAEKEKLLEIIAEKENDELKNMDIEELKKKVAGM